jgi:hypothetical protein
VYYVQANKLLAARGRPPSSTGGASPLAVLVTGKEAKPWEDPVGALLQSQASPQLSDGSNMPQVFACRNVNRISLAELIDHVHHVIADDEQRHDSGQCR